MAEPSDPLGVLNLDPKKLELIRKFFESYTGDAAALTKELQAVGRELGFVAEKTTEAAKAEKVLQGLYQARAKTAGDFNQLLNINKQIRDEELKTAQAALVQAEKSFVTTKERVAVIKEEIDNRAELLKLAQEEYDAETDRIKRLKQAGDLKGAELGKAWRERNERLHFRKEYLASLEGEKKKLILLGREAKKQALAETKKAEEQEKHNSGIEKSVGFLDKMLEQSVVFSEKWQEGPLGGIMDFQEGTKDISNLFGELKTKAGKINFKNIGAAIILSMVEATIKWAIAFDKLSSDFKKHSGIIDKGFDSMGQSISNVQRATIRAGVSMDEAFGAASVLTSEMAAFTSMNDDAQDTVLRSTAILQEFGVSASDTSKIFNIFSKGLGYNAEQLEDLAGTIMAVSTSLKIPPQIIGQEFAAAMSELGKYGMQATEVFTGLAEQSKATGVAISNLISIAKQFDTFQTAGDAVGRLNALLGGPYLNALQMVYASEEERIQLLRESISMSGQVFQDMSRHEKQAIASAAGISDMGEALKLFGTTDAQFARNSMEMKEMEDRAQKAQAVTDKLQQIFMSMAIALGPVVDSVGKLADILLFLLNPIGAMMDLNDEWEAGWGAVTIGVWALIAALKMMKIESAFLTKVFLPVIAAVATFTLLTQILDSMTAGWKAVASSVLVAVAAIALYHAGALAALAGPFAPLVYPVIAASLLAGLWGLMSSVPELASGRETGPGGMYEMAEKGPEGVIPADGSQPYVVENRGTQQLGPGDKVLNEKKTKAALGSSGAAAAAATGGEQLAVLERIAASVMTMAAQIATLNTKLGAEEEASEEKNQYITMDGEKLARIIGPKIAKKYIKVAG